MRAPDRFIGTRIVALPSALDAASWPDGALVFRVAPDEVLVGSEVDAPMIADPHAIVERETGFSGVWLDAAAALGVLERECDWELPRSMRQWGKGSAADQPAFAQGMVAGLPVKLWFERDRVLFIVAAPFAEDLMERLR